MITPNKVVTLEQSALGRVGAIIEQGPHPVSVGGLYQAVRSQFDSVDQFILAMDILYLLQRIHVDFKTRIVTYVS